MDSEEVLAEIVEEFDEAVRRGNGPDIREYLARLSDPAQRDRLLIDLICIELQHRHWDVALLRKRLGEFEEFRGSPSAASGLCRAIYQDRVASGERPCLSDFAGLDLTHEQLDLRYKPNEKPLGYRIGGRYQIDQRLGAGGFGVVYRARDSQRESEVAIKHIPASRLGATVPTAEALHDSLAEFRAVAQLPDPHVVPLYDAMVLDGDVYIVMPYFKEGTLADRIIRENAQRSSPQDALNRVESASGPDELDRYYRHARTVCTLANTLEYVHSRGGILHRDIKPANILMNELGYPLVADFGLAAFRERLAREGDSPCVGTPWYMSPEQCQGLPIDNRSDLFSLGVVLYELLCGVLPFPQPDWYSLSHAIVHSDPLPPRAHEPGIPQALEEVCLRALSKAPDDRPATGAEFGEDLIWAVEQFMHPLPPHDPSFVRREVEVVSERLQAFYESRQVPIEARLTLDRDLPGVAVQTYGALRWPSDWHARPWPELMPAAVLGSLGAAFPDIRPSSVAQGTEGRSGVPALQIDKPGNRLGFSDLEVYFYLVARALFEAISSGDCTLLVNCQYFHNVHRYLAAMIRDVRLAVTASRAIRNLVRWMREGRETGHVRDLAVYQLGVARSISALRRLHSIVEAGQDPELVYYAATALGRVRDQRSLGPLTRRLSAERAGPVRDALKQAIDYVRGLTASPYD